MTDHTPETPQPQLTKVCTKCKCEFPATPEYFGRRKRNKDGLNIWCVSCEKEYQLRYREANRERLKEQWRKRAEDKKDEIAKYQKAWAEKNKDKLTAQRRERYLANRDDILAQRAEYRKANPEKVKASKKAEYARNRERYLEKSREWRLANPERYKEYFRKRGERRTSDEIRVKGQRRRARKNGLPDTFTPQQWQVCIEYFGDCCAVCGRPLYGILHKPHADHWIPLSSPDCPGTIATNMVCLCGGIDGCNESKGSKNPLEWLTEKFGKDEGETIAKRIQAYFDSLPDSEGE